MICSSMYRYHITLDSYDAVYQSNFNILGIQNRTLLNM